MELAVFRLFTMWGVFPSLPQKQTASYKYGWSHCVSSFSHIFTALWNQSGFTANLYTLVLLFWTQRFIVALWGYPSPEICIYQHPLSSSSQSPAHSHCFWHPFNLVYLFPLVSNRWYLFHFPCCLWVIFERREIENVIHSCSNQKSLQALLRVTVLWWRQWEAWQQKKQMLGSLPAPSLWDSFLWVIPRPLHLPLVFPSSSLSALLLFKLSNLRGFYVYEFPSWSHQASAPYGAQPLIASLNDCGVGFLL